MSIVSPQHTTVNNLNRIPEEMRKVPQWVLWRYEPGPKGKPTKVPYTVGGEKASSTNPRTWSTFDAALATYRNGAFDGIGFVLVGDGLVAWDLDNAIDPETGEIKPWAAELVDKLKSYTEVTPSGAGLRVLLRGKLPVAGRKRGDVEVYQDKRYITVTGRHLPSTPETIEDRQAECMAVFEEQFGGRQAAPSPQRTAGPVDLDDFEIIAKAHRAANGALFARLWAGDTSGYTSHSEADQALCNLLAFWTGRDPDRIDRLFRQSGLYREKWEREDYRRQTIEKAIAGTSDVYDPVPKRQRKAAKPSVGVKPEDFSDVGQAKVLVRVFGDRLRYSTATGFLVYDGTRWEASDIKAQALSQQLTDMQLQEARAELQKARSLEDAAVESGDEDAQRDAHQAIKAALEYRKYALARRSSARIEATLREARPMVEMDVGELDADPYLLNTPAGTVNLATGETRPHDPADFQTKITAVAPSEEGKHLFDEFLRVITCGDQELAEYLQMAAGMAAVGKVYSELLLVAYGNGNNGKSTFWGLLSRVLGEYAGGLSADVLTADQRRNKNPEFAELRGKRLVVASELEEGQRLDTATVKRLCSTDPIRAEKKFKDPFDFVPSHTLVLHTNHLPRVSTTDEGTWRRIAVIPFKAKIRPDGDVKNYADFLFEHAGGAVLSWIIEGAKRFIAAGHRLDPPVSVQEAVAAYREQSDWLAEFLAECCETGPGYTVGAGELYAAYRAFCSDTGAYIRRADDFKNSLEQAGFETRRTNKGRVVFGLRLRKRENSHNYWNTPGMRVSGYGKNWSDGQ